MEKVPSGHAVIPGSVVDVIPPKSKKKQVVLGPGLRQAQEEVVATRCGVFMRNGHLYWVDSHQKRYVPVKGEVVIGIITQKTGDVYLVDIGASNPATLSYLSFEGSTKKNRPDVQIGDLVFACLLEASKDMEPELVCMNSLGRKEGFGPLTDGFMFNTSLTLVRKLLSPECFLPQTLGKHMKFELAVGMNGRIWIHGRTVQETIAVAHAIMMLEDLSIDEIAAACNQIKRNA